jgi:hypothetical protein
MEILQECPLQGKKWLICFNFHHFRPSVKAVSANKEAMKEIFPLFKTKGN